VQQGSPGVNPACAEALLTNRSPDCGFLLLKFSLFFV